jgi:hypothetical protein
MVALHMCAVAAEHHAVPVYIRLSAAAVLQVCIRLYKLQFTDMAEPYQSSTRIPSVTQHSHWFCFGDVQAVYDAQRGEFVITTPNNEASKYWIGGSGQHGKVSMAVVDPSSHSHQHLRQAGLRMWCTSDAAVVATACLYTTVAGSLE